MLPEWAPATVETNNDEVGPSGETIIDYSIYDAIRTGFGKIVFVIRRDIEEQVKEKCR